MTKRKEFNGLKDVAGVSNAIRNIVPSDLTNDDVIFVCVGTDRSTGDSLGPLIGSELQKLGYTNVYGTLAEPVHGMNLQETMDELPKDKYIIAIDACLGQLSSVGTIFMKNEPLKPGAGVNKDLPKIGDCVICGVVNVGGFMEYFVLQNTRLYSVIKMAEKIISAIIETFPRNAVVLEEVAPEIELAQQEIAVSEPNNINFNINLEIDIPNKKKKHILFWKE